MAEDEPKKRGRGRPFGSKGKPKVVLTNAIQRAVESGVTPLEFMLSQMRNASNPMPFRSDMAKAAAPYCHARLQATEVTGEVELIKYEWNE